MSEGDLKKMMTPVQVLREYFGLKQTQKLQDFAREIRELSAEEKNELVILAAKQLDVDIKEVI